MKNASAIERCIDAMEAIKTAWAKEQGKAARTELAELQSRPKYEGEPTKAECESFERYTEIGPCERGHLKMFWIECVNPDICPCGGYCSLCREIEQAVEREVGQTIERLGICETHMDTTIADANVSDPCPLCRADERIEREVAGAYEAAAQRLLDMAKIRRGALTHADIALSVAAQEIRSLDSAAAQRGKQAIREEALKEAAQLIPCSCVQTICSQPGCGEIHKCIDPYCLHHKICELIDKPGGR